MLITIFDVNVHKSSKLNFHRIHILFSQKFWLSDDPAVPGTHGPVVVSHVLRITVPELHVPHNLQLDTKQRTIIGQ